MPNRPFQHSFPAVLDPLAAAYAEAGRFDRAVRTAEKAIQLALAAGKEELAKDIQSRLELYKAKRPYREPSSPDELDHTQPREQQSSR